MATKQDFLDKQAKFNETWGINVSIEPLETGIRKIAQLKNFTLEQKTSPQTPTPICSHTFLRGI